MSGKSGVLYIGATNDFDRRVFERRQGQDSTMADYARGTARGPSTPAAFAQDD
ncbi:MAG TPA: hypothetical protein VNE82_12695 [Candidatus Binataceae bacterium]|nr:hypothetical protein [Candidatus Binataceae bacterium]